MSDKSVSRVLVMSVVTVVLWAAVLLRGDEPVNQAPEIVRSYKVGDEPSVHRVWRMVVDGRVIEYVEIVVPK